MKKTTFLFFLATLTSIVLPTTNFAQDDTAGLTLLPGFVFAESIRGLGRWGSFQDCGFHRGHSRRCPYAAISLRRGAPVAPVNRPFFSFVTVRRLTLPGRLGSAVESMPNVPAEGQRRCGHRQQTGDDNLQDWNPPGNSDRRQANSHHQGRS